MANKKTFDTVWYRSEEFRLTDFFKPAWQDKGILEVGKKELVFKGRKQTVRITNVKSVSYGQQGRDNQNNWVKIEYQNGKTAFLADGGYFGLRAKFGGTKKILDEVTRLHG